MENAVIQNIPNLDITQQRFLVSSGPTEYRDEAKRKLEAYIKEENMAPLYTAVCEEFNFPLDQALLSQMEDVNKKTLATLNEKIADAEQNLGETEVNEALVAKAEFYAKIGDKENAVAAYTHCLEKFGQLGARIDVVFALLRIGLFYNDHELIKSNIERAKTLVEEGGDWDRRNRLKVYEGLYLMSIRDFKTAANLFLDTLSTFTSTELMSYAEFVKFAVLCSMISLQRVDIKKRVLDAPEILEVLHDVPHLEEYMNSLYNGNYAQFFRSLAAVETQHLMTSRYLYPHRRYYVREMKIIAYAQLLESYRSLTLESMAHAFGVSESYIDSDLSRFIAASRLNCVIDKVNGIVETNRPDSKNAQYQAVIKQGDLLLNRIQKLSRVINVCVLSAMAEFTEQEGQNAAEFHPEIPEHRLVQALEPHLVLDSPALAQDASDASEKADSNSTRSKGKSTKLHITQEDVDAMETTVPMHLPGVSVTSDIYKAHNDLLKKTSMTRSHSASDVLADHRSHKNDLLEEDPVLENIDKPGGFRRFFVSRKEAILDDDVISEMEGSVASPFRPSRDSGDYFDPASVYPEHVGTSTQKTRNFLEFLAIETMFYGFAGEDLSDSDDDEEKDRVVRTYPGRADYEEERRPLLERRKSSRRVVKDKDKASTFKTFFLLIKAFIGTGVLFLPQAFKNGGLIFSFLFMWFVSMVSLAGFIMLLQCKDVAGGSYGDIGGALFGPWMRRMVLTAIALAQIGFVCGGSIFIAENVQSVIDAITDSRVNIPTFTILWTAGVLLMPLVLVRNIAKLSFTAIISDTLIVIGLIILFYHDYDMLTHVNPIEQGVHKSIVPGPDIVWGINLKTFATFIGTSVYSFEGIGLVIPIRDAMHEPEKFNRVLFTVMMVITTVFTCVGFFGYLAYGKNVQTVALLNLPPGPLVNTIQLLYAVAIVLSNPVILFPAIRIIEQGLFGPHKTGRNNPVIKWQKNCLRISIVVLGICIAWIGAADLDKFISLIGSVCCTPLSFIFPPLFHYKCVAESKAMKAFNIAFMTFVFKAHKEHDGELSYGTLIQNAVEVTEIDTNLYSSEQLWTPIGARGVFGGQVVAQAIRAATRTVPKQFTLHSLHSYFILPGNNQIPIIYQVERVRDGRSYATRTVKAIQKGRSIFTCMFSFSMRDPGITLEHQPVMPSVPEPETLPNAEERTRFVLEKADATLPRKYKEFLLQRLEEHSPMDYRNTHVPTTDDFLSSERRKEETQTQWFKTVGTLPDDPTLHQACVAYASDSSLIGTATVANGLSRSQIGMMASLDHSMWFHAPFRADDWLLYEMNSPRTSGGRGLAFGRIYRRDGTLVVSVAQEGIVRLSEQEQARRREQV
ncbi:hypothetical protein BZG36_00435 [Bifiguratus adelaidae]|uniref:PCI domain-containing protein n=1 Tax=Bifiguratus adelaidae TaxID=1938954 RepID=A0A261Y7W7_9FUNG|nr:hypothetical protein BZG36_00435 [Bifiguratus adelaidae]